MVWAGKDSEETQEEKITTVAYRKEGSTLLIKDVVGNISIEPHYEQGEDRNAIFADVKGTDQIQSFVKISSSHGVASIMMLSTSIDSKAHIAIRVPCGTLLRLKNVGGNINIGSVISPIDLSTRKGCQVYVNVVRDVTAFLDDDSTLDIKQMCGKLDIKARDRASLSIRDGSIKGVNAEIATTTKINVFASGLNIDTAKQLEQISAVNTIAMANGRRRARPHSRPKSKSRRAKTTRW